MSAMSRQRQYQLRHRRAGLCHDCNRSVVNGGLFCEVHRRERNLRNREWQRRKFRRKARYRKAESYKFKENKAYERRRQNSWKNWKAAIRSRCLQ
jgi:hypothetical protein